MLLAQKHSQQRPQLSSFPDRPSVPPHPPRPVARPEQSIAFFYGATTMLRSVAPTSYIVPRRLRPSVLRISTHSRRTSSSRLRVLIVLVESLRADRRSPAKDPQGNRLTHSDRDQAAPSQFLVHC